VGGPGPGPFSISVAAELAGLHPQTLRIYEREGLLDPARSAGGTRRYSRRDIEKLAEICALTADGLNLAGIRRVLALQEETRQLQAELARLRELAGEQPAARPARQPRLRAGSGSSPGRPGSAVPLAEPFVQAGGQGALGGKVVLQVQDPQRGGQGVPLVEQLPDPGGEGQLAAGVAAAAGPPCLALSHISRSAELTSRRATAVWSDRSCTAPAMPSCGALEVSVTAARYPR
jgi:MerR family transcriptional regulator, heat shock protein HspR